SNPFTGSPEWCNNYPPSYSHTYGTGGCGKLRQCIDQLNSEVGSSSNAFTTPRDAYVHRQQCQMAATDDAMQRLQSYVACRGANCPPCVNPGSGADAGPGWGVLGQACQACLAANCSAQVTACDAD